MDRLPERRCRLGVHCRAGADDSDAMAARARGPAEVVLEAQEPLRRVADVLAAGVKLLAGLADHRERGRAREEDDGLLEGRHDEGARSANLA